MAEIRRSARLDVPLTLAFGALGETLRDIASREGPWEGFALHVDFADAGFPDVGYIAVPIDLDVGTAESGVTQLSVTVRALRHPESFPTFTGAFGIESTGPTGATVWIAGTYEVPMSALGRIVDATLLHGIAEHALANLLDDVAAAVRARIEKRETDYMRYRLFPR